MRGRNTRDEISHTVRPIVDNSLRLWFRPSGKRFPVGQPLACPIPRLCSSAVLRIGLSIGGIWTSKLWFPECSGIVCTVTGAFGLLGISADILIWDMVPPRHGVRFSISGRGISVRLKEWGLKHRVRLPVRGRRGAGGRGTGGGIAPERLRAAAVGALQPGDAPRGGGDGGDVFCPGARPASSGRGPAPRPSRPPGGAP